MLRILTAGFVGVSALQLNRAPKPNGDQAQQDDGAVEGYTPPLDVFEAVERYIPKWQDQTQPIAVAQQNAGNSNDEMENLMSAHGKI